MDYYSANKIMVFYQIGQFPEYQPYLVTKQLIGSNALGREKFHKLTFNKAHLLIRHESESKKN